MDIMAFCHLMIGLAESATCGQMTYIFSLAQHAWKFLKGGVSCYDAAINEKVLMYTGNC